MRKDSKEEKEVLVYELRCINNPEHEKIEAKSLEEINKEKIEFSDEGERLAYSYKCKVCGGKLKVTNVMTLIDFNKIMEKLSEEDENE